MKVQSRIQLNLLLDKTKFNTRVKPFDNTVLPIVWLQISVERLTTGLIVLLHFLFNILPYAQVGLVCLLCVVGVSLFAVAAISHCFSTTPRAEYNPKRDVKWVFSVFCFVPRKYVACMTGNSNLSTAKIRSHRPIPLNFSQFHFQTISNLLVSIH